MPPTNIREGIMVPYFGAELVVEVVVWKTGVVDWWCSSWSNWFGVGETANIGTVWNVKFKFLFQSLYKIIFLLATKNFTMMSYIPGD